MKTLTITRPREGAAQITMSRPEVYNAFDEVMIAELGQAFTRLTSDESVRVIILAGDGKHFSAGADLQWMQRASTESQEWNLNDARIFAKMLANIAACPKPTVARIQGLALGGGVGLVCACDIAIAEQNAKFAVSEAKFGILPSVIGPHLINAIGKRQAKWLALSTTRIEADAALRIGLVQQCVPADKLDSTIDALLKELLAGGPNAHQEIKQLFAQLEVQALTQDVIELTAKTISRVRVGDEAKEGFKAFIEKRSPNWVS